MSKKLLIYKKIPQSGCCMLSILMHIGYSLSDLAIELQVTERTVRRLLAGQRLSPKTGLALTNFYLHCMINSG